MTRRNAKRGTAESHESMFHRSAPVIGLISLGLFGCGQPDPSAATSSDIAERPWDPVSRPPGDGDSPSTTAGQSGGEGAAAYSCWCDRLADRVVVRATVVDSPDDAVALQVLEVLGRHVTEKAKLEGETFTAAHSEECGAPPSVDPGAEVLAFYRPQVIGRAEDEPCGETYAACTAACEALTPNGDAAPARCITGCSAAADVECGPLFPSGLPDADPSTWVVVPWSDPRVQNLSDPHALGMSVDDLEGPATCPLALRE